MVADMWVNVANVVFTMLDLCRRIIAPDVSSPNVSQLRPSNKTQIALGNKSKIKSPIHFAETEQDVALEGSPAIRFILISRVQLKANHQFKVSNDNEIVEWFVLVLLLE